VQYDDRITVSTPEGVDLTLELAGVGTRFLADLVDALIRIIPIVAIAVAAGSIGGVGIAIGAVAIFLLIFAYDVLFETQRSGRTPGKKAAGLRVVTDTGGPVDFRASAIRNLLRLVDFLPGWYLVGVITILATKKNQRLGDLAARTLVVREEVATVPNVPVVVPGLPLPPQPVIAPSDWDVSAITSSDLEQAERFLVRRADLVDGARERLAGLVAANIRAKVPYVARDLADEAVVEHLVAVAGPRLHVGTAVGWDVSAVTADEMVALRRFLERRIDLDRAARDRLVETLAARLRPKVLGVDEEMEDERFLERLAAAKAARA
jgi:uncharacterized RDD family membrane protein YckC